MNENKKKWIKRGILLGVDAILTTLLAFSRFNNPPAGEPIPVFHALTDAFFVIGFFNFGFGVLFWISATGFFDIFGYSFKAALNFFLPRRYTENTGDYYEYKVKKQERRKESFVPAEMLWIGLAMILISIVFYALV